VRWWSRPARKPPKDHGGDAEDEDGGHALLLRVAMEAEPIRFA